MAGVQPHDGAHTVGDEGVVVPGWKQLALVAEVAHPTHDEPVALGCGRIASRTCPPDREHGSSSRRHSPRSEGLSHNWISTIPLPQRCTQAQATCSRATRPRADDRRSHSCLWVIRVLAAAAPTERAAARTNSLSRVCSRAAPRRLSLSRARSSAEMRHRRRPSRGHPIATTRVQVDGAVILPSGAARAAAVSSSVQSTGTVCFVHNSVRSPVDLWTRP
jgi:hypothetical protein